MTRLGVWIAKRVPWRLWDHVTVNGRKYVSEDIAERILAERDRIYRKYVREKKRRMDLQEKKR